MPMTTPCIHIHEHSSTCRWINVCRYMGTVCLGTRSIPGKVWVIDGGMSCWLQTVDRLKTPTAEEAFNKNGLSQRTIRLLKDKFPDLEVRCIGPMMVCCSTPMAILLAWACLGERAMGLTSKPPTTSLCGHGSDGRKVGKTIRAGNDAKLVLDGCLYSMWVVAPCLDGLQPRLLTLGPRRAG